MSTSITVERIAEASPRLKARIAGGLWLLCIVASVGGFIAGAPLIVANDAAATAKNILANESLFRLGFAADLISGLSYLGATVFTNPTATAIRTRTTINEVGLPSPDFGRLADHQLLPLSGPQPYGLTVPAIPGDGLSHRLPRSVRRVGDRAVASD